MRPDADQYKSLLIFNNRHNYYRLIGIHARRLEKMGALVIDNKKYARVLAKVLPRVITTDEEHERMLAEVEKLMDKASIVLGKRTPPLT